MRGEESTMRRR